MARPKKVARGQTPGPPTYCSPGLNALREVTNDSERDWQAVAAHAIAKRIAGYTVREIADDLHVSRDTVEQWFLEARRNAQLLDVGPLLDHVALPLAVDNLIDGLRAGNEEFTLKTLGGRGAFSAHSKAETHQTSMTLNVQVEMPTRESAPRVVGEGQVVGIPRVIAEEPRDGG